MNIDLKGKTYTFSEYDDLTINQFRSIQLSLSSTKSSTDKLIECISILIGCQPEDLRDVAWMDLKQLEPNIVQLVTCNPDGYDKTFELNSVKYGLVSEPGNLTLGEFADIDTLLKEESNIWDVFHKILAILYRPVIKTGKKNYDIAPYDGNYQERAELFDKELKIKHVYGCILFFYALGTNYIKHIQNYLKRPEVQKMIQTYQEEKNQSALLNTGDGLK